VGRCAGCVAETRKLAGARLHSLVGELSSCAAAVDISSPELSADVLSCLEAPLHGLVGLASNKSDARAPASMEHGLRGAARLAGPTDEHTAVPIWPNTSSSSARRLLQQPACAADEIQYQTACGIFRCNVDDRLLGVSCDGCGFLCSTTLKTGTSEICCRKPTPGPTAAPNKNPTGAPISAPPSAPAATKISNCGLLPAAPADTYTTVRAAIDVLHTRKLNGSNAPLSLKVRLGSDEALNASVGIPVNVSLEVDGAGRTITLSDFGFQVDGGRLCLHDVELTGGRNVPALVVLGQIAVANASHVRISNCATFTDLGEIAANLVSALDGCNPLKNAVAKIPSLLLPTFCDLFPPYAQQCCDPSKKGPKADLRVALNFVAGMASLGWVWRAHPLSIRPVGVLSSGCQLVRRVQVCYSTKGSCPWWRVTSMETR
jgi:hypothetical protein